MSTQYLEPYLEPHQTRDHEPDAYENLLGDAIERCYAAGIHDLDGLVARLNEACVPTPGGVPWSVELFTSEMKRLGA